LAPGRRVYPKPACPFASGKGRRNQAERQPTLQDGRVDGRG